MSHRFYLAVISRRRYRQHNLCFVWECSSSNCKLPSDSREMVQFTIRMIACVSALKICSGSIVEVGVRNNEVSIPLATCQHVSQH